MIILRKDLIIPSLAVGFSSVAFMTIGYTAVLMRYLNLVQDWWELNNISGVLILNIPLEEYLWFLAAGLAFGTLYEFWKGIRFTSIESK